MSRKLLNRFRCSNPSSGPKSQILPRAKFARFQGRALLAAAQPWARRGPAAGLVARWSRVRLLKRVVPGSVPPWRALCAEPARALKAFFSVLCVSKSVLLLGSKLAWAAGAAGHRRSFCGLAVARPQVVPGSFPPARACFSLPRRCFGLPQRFSWPRRGFPLPAIKKARQPFVIITLDPLSEHFRGRNALGFARRRTSKLAGRRS